MTTLTTIDQVRAAFAREEEHHVPVTLADTVRLREAALHAVEHGWLVVEWDEGAGRIVGWRLTDAGRQAAEVRGE